MLMTDPSDPVALYERASSWTLTKVRGATDSLDGRTSCDDWDVRTLLNHMLDTQRYFTGVARGEEVDPPSPNPPNLIGSDPIVTFEQSRSDLLRAFRQAGVLDQAGPALGIAFADQLLHGWDLAEATDQDTTMPEELPGAAYQIIHGRFTDEQRVGIFKPEIDAPRDASPQDRLLAYTGRHPS
jgi:uncharacterized protein (TIGR03086 family)